MHLNKQRGEERVWGSRDTGIFTQRDKLIKSTDTCFVWVPTESSRHFYKCFEGKASCMN
jgi:hypothetical protein